MIVDLMRNDVSRIARTGTVRVPALLTVERYATVLQLTSDITAQMRPGTGLAELFAALFPCGSVTGTPKARTMALIRELEDTPRGIYCGAIGWVAPPTEHGILAHAEGLGDPRARPARQGQQERPRPIRLAPIARVAESHELTPLRGACDNRGFARHNPPPKPNQEMESQTASVGHPAETCLAEIAKRWT